MNLAEVWGEGEVETPRLVSYICSRWRTCQTHRDQFEQQTIFIVYDCTRTEAPTSYKSACDQWHCLLELSQYIRIPQSSTLAPATSASTPKYFRDIALTNSLSRSLHTSNPMRTRSSLATYIRPGNGVSAVFCDACARVSLSTIPASVPSIDAVQPRK